MRILAFMVIAFSVFGGGTQVSASQMNSSDHAVDAAATTNGGGSSFSASYSVAAMVRNGDAAIGKSAGYAVTGDLAFFGVPSEGRCSGVVTAAALRNAINMFLGVTPPTNCVDLNDDKIVSIAEVQRVVGSFLKR